MFSCAQGGLIGLPQGFQRYQGLRAFQRYSDAPDVGEESILTGSDAIFGDVIAYTTPVVPGGYPFVITNEGLPDVTAGGDTSRQTFSADLYRFLLRMWTGDTGFAINNRAPIGPDPGSTLFVAQNVAITPVDLTPYAPDPELDAVTVICTNPALLPVGTSVVGSAFTGTPTVRAITLGVPMRSTDVWGASVDWLADIVVGQVDVPNVRGLSLAGADPLLQAVYLTVTEGTPQYSETFLLGTIISQSPAFPALADPNTSVTVVLSLGPNPLPIRRRNVTHSERRRSRLID